MKNDSEHRWTNGYSPILHRLAAASFCRKFCHDSQSAFPKQGIPLRFDTEQNRLRCILFEKLQTYFYYTITAYGTDIEPGVPSINESIETLMALSTQVGKKRVAWRYDPVLLTDVYTIERHLQTFERAASIISPYIDRCIFSFVEMYKKLKTNMPELIPLTEQDKEQIAEGLGAIAKKYGIFLQTCGTNGDYSRYGINKSGCMTLDILGKSNGIEFKNLKHKGMREGCHCIESRDIGAYDTCMNGCKYCYANKTPRKAFENYKFHNPMSPLLLGELKPEDTVIRGVQKSFMIRK